MRKIVFPFMLLINFSLSAQNLEQHRWQNRLLVIIDNESSSSKRLKQLLELEKDQNGLKERRLLIYQFTPKGYKIGLEEKKWSAITKKIGRINPQKPGFTVYLIGLDGGVKIEKKEVVALDYIFALIDGMPMRRAELRGR